MRNFFSKMLKGYVFIIIDINIGIDIIPDIIGYFIIASALAKLTTTKGANTARLLAIILGVVSIFDMQIFQSFWSSAPSQISFIFGVGMSLLILCFYYYIFAVSLHLLQQSPHMLYTKQVKYIMLGSTWLTAVFPAIVLHVSENDLMLFAVVLLVVAFISLIVFIVYLYKMKIYAEIEEQRVVKDEVEL